MNNKEAIEFLKNMIDQKAVTLIDNDFTARYHIDALQMAIKALRSERPHGKWIEHCSKEMSEKGYFLCSKCKCGFQRFARGVRHSDLPWIDGQKYELLYYELHYIDNFCPNCGADMRETKNEQ